MVYSNNRQHAPRTALTGTSRAILMSAKGLYDMPNQTKYEKILDALQSLLENLPSGIRDFAAGKMEHCIIWPCMCQYTYMLIVRKVRQ